MALTAQIALGVIIGGLTIALLVTGFLVWNSRQRNERLAIGLFIAGAVIIVVLVVVVSQFDSSKMVLGGNLSLLTPLMPPLTFPSSFSVNSMSFFLPVFSRVSVDSFRCLVGFLPHCILLFRRI